MQSLQRDKRRLLAMLAAAPATAYEHPMLREIDIVRAESGPANRQQRRAAERRTVKMLKKVNKK